MDQASTPTPGTRAAGVPPQYGPTYGHFRASIYEEIRREAFGEDIGSNSWLTAGELDRFVEWLGLSSGKILLDVACGSGGPALRVAAMTGCSLVGVDVHPQAIATASALAAERGLDRARFQVVDASGPLPFPDAGFDAITCIDAINHLSDRRQVIADWARLLKPGGRILFTDPIILTGPMTGAEIRTRSSTSFYLFVPAGYDEGVIADCGLHLTMAENRTRNMAEIAERRMAARARRSSALREIEGDARYEEDQEFLAVTSRTAAEGRLSRWVFVAAAP